MSRKDIYIFFFKKKFIVFETKLALFELVRPPLSVKTGTKRPASEDVTGYLLLSTVDVSSVSHNLFLLLFQLPFICTKTILSLLLRFLMQILPQGKSHQTVDQNIREKAAMVKMS